MACDPYWNQVVLALHMDGTNGSTTFTDVTGKTVTANGNAQISTTQSKFGGASAYFDGTGDYLSLANSTNFNFGTGDFTIECWIYPTAYPQSWAGSYYSTIVGKDVYSARGYALNVAGNGTFASISFSGWSNNSTYQEVAGALTGQITLNTWKHVCACRNGNTLCLFVDGALITAGAFTINIQDTGNTVRIGAAEFDATYKGYFTGYIDDLRITKGVARYTANFTAPTAAFPDNQCVISGVVGSPGNYLERIVRAYRRDTGAFVGQAVSNPTTGAYSISAQHGGECFAIVHDSASIVSGAPIGGTNNAIIYDRLTPA